MVDFELIAQDWHRNGCGGNGFVVSIFNWFAEDAKPHNPFIAISFEPEDEFLTRKQSFIANTAVISLPLALAGNIDFAEGNSWRGSGQCGPFLADAFQRHCLSTKRPFDPFAEEED